MALAASIIIGFAVAATVTGGIALANCIADWIDSRWE